MDWERHLTLCRLASDHAFAFDKPTVLEYKARGLYRADIIHTRNTHMADYVNSKLKLKPAFPINLSKTVGSRFGFFVTHKESKRFAFYNFHSPYAAKHFLLMMLDECKPTFPKPGIIETPDIHIRAEVVDQIDDALEHKFTKDEEKWQAPEPYYSEWYRFIHGRRPSTLPSHAPQSPHSIADDAPKTTVAPAKQKRSGSRKSTSQLVPSPASSKPPRKAPPGRKKPADKTTPADLAAEFKIAPRQVRELLRQHKINKPYAWDKAEADRIRTLITKALPTRN
jgi:hypothetical protein